MLDGRIRSWAATTEDLCDQGGFLVQFACHIQITAMEYQAIFHVDGILAKDTAAFLVILPFAAMGIPFPLLLRHLGQTQGELLPWAWAVNGCASVVAGPLATLLALGTGLPGVLLSAAGCYFLAALVSATWRAERCGSGGNPNNS